MIRWFANNSIAANLLMVGILLAGIYTALYRVPLEVSPSRQYNTVRIDMRYRGATARDVGERKTSSVTDTVASNRWPPTRLKSERPRAA